jgi:hypothetical protein
VRFDERAAEERRPSLRATIEEIATAKVRHLPIGDAFPDCVAWCPACHAERRRSRAAGAGR